jgi:hypothetical protein
MSNQVIDFWNVKKEKLKDKFPIITDQDLNFHDGREKEMLEILGFKLGKSKQELLYIIITL